MTTRSAEPTWPAIEALPGPWVIQAACARSPYPDCWHPTNEDGWNPVAATDYAKSICKECPVRLDCLQWALEAGPTATFGGIYGGVTFDERRKMRSGR